MNILFLNRKEEMDRLLEIILSDNAALIRMYGDRQLGKTELLTQLALRLSGRKPVYYYQCTQISSEIQLEQIQDELKSLLDDKTIVFRTWENFFTYILVHADLFCILDEFPYLVEAEPGIPSLLQKVWDQTHRTSTSKILLCGSLVSIMEELASGEKPLYGRFTNTFRIEPLNFLQTQLFLPNIGLEQQFLLYAVFGGVPGYLVKLQNHYLSELENVLINVVFRKDSPFQEPFPNVVRTQADLRSRERYNSVLWAISNGKHTYSDINNAAKLGKNINLTRYLNTLERLNVIKRCIPFLTSKPTRYLISDSFTHFWYQYYKKTLSPENYVKNVVMPSLPSDFLSFRFEDFCRELIQHLSIQGKFSDTFEDVHSFDNGSIEIDIVALGQSKKTLILGECKWQNRSPLRSDLREFMTKCHAFFQIIDQEFLSDFDFNSFNEIEYVFFSRKEADFPQGVPKDLQHVHLVSLNELEQWIILPADPPVKIL